MEYIKRILLLVIVALSFQGYAQIKVYQTFDELQNEWLTYSDTTNDTIYVVNFWATWCRPCVKELPYLIELDGTKLDKRPVKVRLISLDMESALETKVEPLIQNKGIKSGVALLADEDANSWIDKVDPSWSGAIPATVIFVKGEKYFRERSYLSADDLKKDITSLL